MGFARVHDDINHDGIVWINIRNENESCSTAHVILYDAEIVSSRSVVRRRVANGDAKTLAAAVILHAKNPTRCFNEAAGN